MMTLSDDFKRALRLFAFFYTNGTLDMTILKDIDYRELLKDEASIVEQVFAIFANNIKMDEKGNVLNEAYAAKRAAQWIRLMCPKEGDPFVATPEFEDWETELH